MSLTAEKTKYEHIVLNENGVPTIAGTNMKIIELILGKIAYGWSPEELHFQYPHLTLGQIYSALAFYCDHHEGLDQDIEERLENIEQIHKSIWSSPLVSRLKSKGLI